MMLTLITTLFFLHPKKWLKKEQEGIKGNERNILLKIAAGFFERADQQIRKVSSTEFPPLFFFFFFLLSLFLCVLVFCSLLCTHLLQPVSPVIEEAFCVSVFSLCTPSSVSIGFCFCSCISFYYTTVIRQFVDVSSSIFPLLCLLFTVHSVSPAVFCLVVSASIVVLFFFYRCPSLLHLPLFRGFLCCGWVYTLMSVSVCVYVCRFVSLYPLKSLRSPLSARLDCPSMFL